MEFVKVIVTFEISQNAMFWKCKEKDVKFGIKNASFQISLDWSKKLLLCLQWAIWNLLKYEVLRKKKIFTFGTKNDLFEFFLRWH